MACIMVLVLKWVADVLFLFDSTSLLNARVDSLMIRVNLTCGLWVSRFSKSSWVGRHSRTRTASSSIRTRISKSIGREQYVFSFSSYLQLLQLLYFQLRGKWVGKWEFSKGMEKLLQRMIAPNADLRCTAMQAIADSYWKDSLASSSLHSAFFFFLFGMCFINVPFLGFYWIRTRV